VNTAALSELMSPALSTRRFCQFPLVGPDGGQVFTEIQGRGFDGHSALSPTSLEDLISSIGTGGLLSPVLLEQLGERSYRLIAGERRLRAMRWGSANHPTNPHFQQLAAVVVDGPLSAQDRRRFQLIENLAREDLRPGELAAALLFERCAVLAARLLVEGVAVADAVIQEDPVSQWQALDQLRIEAGLHNVGAPWDEVIGLIGLSISPRRAKSLVTAFRAMPAEVAAQMDESGVTLASRQQWLELGKKGRDGAADEIWAALAELDRPELLTRTCQEALEHPGAEVDELVELAVTVHDRVKAAPEEPDVDRGAVGLVVALAETRVIEAGEHLEVLTALATKLRAGERLHPYDAGSLRLRVRELADLLDGDIEQCEPESAEAAA